MGIADSAPERWVEAEEKRAERWRHDSTVVGPVSDAAYGVLQTGVTRLVAAASRVRIPRTWDATVAQFQDGQPEAGRPDRLPSPGRGLGAPIGQCRACHATVPLSPPIGTFEELAAALEYEVPADHDCLGHPQIGDQ